MAVVENEYRVIGPPGCVEGSAIIEVNRIHTGAAGVSRKFRLDHLVERFNSAVPGGYFRGNGYARKTTTLWDSNVRTRVRCMSPDGLIVLAPLVRAIDSGLKEVHELELEDGRKLRVTEDHEIHTRHGMLSYRELCVGCRVSVDGGVRSVATPKKKASYLSYEGLKYHPFCGRVESRRYSVLVHRIVVEAAMNGVSTEFFVDMHRSGFAANAKWKYLQPNQVVHHKDRDIKNNSLDNLEVIDNQTEHSRLHCNEGRWRDVIAEAVECRVVRKTDNVGVFPTYDLTVYVEDGQSGNFLANGIVVSNCGKTTYLSTQVSQRVERWCADTGLEPRQCQDVLVSSLTKAAAGEVLSRGLSLPDEQVGTLHAHALHALGNPKLCVGPKQISEWNKQAKMDHWIKGGSVSREEDGFSLDVGQFRGDELMNEYTINRCRMTPREQWRSDVVSFADAFEKWKFMNSYMDYTDLIDTAFRQKVAPPGNPSTILVDECQDHDRLELRLLRYWATKVNKLIIVGDPDQCQPGDTIIDLAGGTRKRLDEIDPVSDRLTCYDRHSAKLVGLRDGLNFKKVSRSYTGRLATVELENGKSTRCTHDHRWLAKWKVRSETAHVVYVMHKGDRWRVGFCKLWGKCGLHFSQRCRLEGADAGWILKTFESAKDAAVYEKIVSIKFGLPLICFNPREGHEYVDEVFKALIPENQALKATLCLSDHGRDYHHPFWSKSERLEKQGCRAPLILRTCNLLPEYMSLPHRIAQGKSETEWKSFAINHRFVRDFEVFSLDVETHHNYVADGIVTMNNLYEWRGSDPGGFYESEIPEGHTKVLEQSYRVPRKVHAAAMEMIGRCGDGRKQVVYHPRDEQGEVSFAPYSLRMDPVEAVREIERLLDEPDSKPGQAKVMLLFSCAYMTQPITTALRDAGIPFWNPYSRERSNFNPLHPAKGMSTLDRILRYLKPNEEANGADAKMWTWADFHEWSELCNAEGWLRHGAKAELKRRAASNATQAMSVEDIESVLSGPDVLAELEKVDLGFLAPRIADAKLNVYNYVVDIQRKRGYNELSNNPRCIVGTVHSVKGAEADHVFLSPDLSSSGWEVYGSRHIDSLHRLFYVGLTRAYRRLVLCQASSPRAIQW